MRISSTPRVISEKEKLSVWNHNTLASWLCINLYSRMQALPNLMWHLPIIFWRISMLCQVPHPFRFPRGLQRACKCQWNQKQEFASANEIRNWIPLYAYEGEGPMYLYFIWPVQYSMTIMFCSVPQDGRGTPSNVKVRYGIESFYRNTYRGRDKQEDHLALYVLYCYYTEKKSRCFLSKMKAREFRNMKACSNCPLQMLCRLQESFKPSSLSQARARASEDCNQKTCLGMSMISFRVCRKCQC